MQANITAREVVVMGKVNGNIDCSDRVDIRSEGSVTGDVSTVRISVEDGAVLKGGIEVTQRRAEAAARHSLRAKPGSSEAHRRGTAESSGRNRQRVSSEQSGFSDQGKISESRQSADSCFALILR